MTLTEGRGQTASDWRVYRAGDGLAQSACVSAAVSPTGRVVVKHLDRKFLSELDGYSIRVLPLPESLNGALSQSGGGQLWTVVPEGLQEYRNNTWVLRNVPEIAALFQKTGPSSLLSIPLCPVRQGRVLFLLPDRLMEFNTENPERPRTDLLRPISQTRLEKFTGLLMARDGSVWISGSRGLAKMPKPGPVPAAEAGWVELLPPDSLGIRNLQEPREDDQGGVTLPAEFEQGGGIAHCDGQNWSAQPVPGETVIRAWRSADRTIWVMTPNTLLQQAPGQTGWRENQDIAARQYYDVATGPGSAFWLATSDGLFHHMLPVWRSPEPVRQLTALVHGLAEDAEGRLWFVAAGKLHCLDNDAHSEYALPARIAADARAVHGLFVLKNGTLVLAGGDEPALFRPDSGRFSGSGRRLVPLGLMADGTLCLRPREPDGAGAGGWVLFDGTEFKPLPNPPAELPFGGFSVLYSARNGDLWLGAGAGVAWRHQENWRSFAGRDNTVPDAVVGFTELADGRIWCASQNRIWQFDGQNWSLVRAGFERVNSLWCGRDGSVWVADDNGLYRFYQNNWLVNGREDGLAGTAVREVREDKRGRLWAGTTRGLSRYYPEADTDPPRTAVWTFFEKEGSIREDETMTVAFGGNDKWNLTPRERLLYSYRLDERDWSPFQTASSVSFNDLSPGKHYFQVRAVDRNFNIDPRPALLEWVVVLPWYHEVRLVLIAVGGALIALFFAGLAFNRHRQLVRSYAIVEQKVTERTRELEIANRELLHSQKMNALGTLAAGIAHDFNNILSIIKGSAQIIEDNLQNPDKIRTRVDRIKTVVEQGSGIVKAMLGFSRDSDGLPGPGDVNAVVRDTIRLLGDRFLREVAVRFEPGPGLPEVPMSRDFIQQILLNFIFNAAESMARAARKEVILTTRLATAPPPGVVLAPAGAGAYVTIAVRDFGCGISPENLSRVFEPFFTTKALSTRRGTGLGLSMAYELARKMEAGIAMESAPEQGSTFTLILAVRQPVPSKTVEPLNR